MENQKKIKQKFDRKIKILKMKDSSDKSTKKYPPHAFDTAFRLAITGNSGAGKTNMVSNLILDPEKQFYRDVWKGEDIFIFSGSTKTDMKLKQMLMALDVPESNVFSEYDDDIINLLYDEIEDRVQETKGKIEPSLFIFDDLSFDSAIRSKRNNALGRLFLNGRKNNISSIFIAQKYNQIPPAVRVNLTGLIIYRMPQSELEAIALDHNFKAKKKDFFKMFDLIEEKHDAIIINYSNPHKQLYLYNFEVI